jgi:hypothetical protein
MKMDGLQRIQENSSGREETTHEKDATCWKNGATFNNLRNNQDIQDKTMLQVLRHKL